MDIAYSARSPRGELPWQFIADAAALAEWADVLFVTLAATANTYHIVSKKVISALGSEGLLVNISRVQNVDEKALLQPHHASGTHETRRAMGQLMIANLNAHFMGKHLLTPVV
jgi:lactate dehydrogenase-like 2-hydroxyacid dehydrogenase